MTDNGYIPIGIDVDEQSFDALNRSVDTTDDNLGQLVDTNQAIAQSADDVSNRMQSAFSKMRANIDDNINAVQALRTQVQGLGDDTDQVNNNSGGDGGDSSGGGGGLGIGGLRRSGAILNRAGLGAVGQPLQIAGEAEQLSKTFGDIGDSITGLTSNLGELAVAAPLAGIAVAGIALAITAFDATLNDAKTGVDAGISQLKDYYAVIEKGTTDSIQAELKGLEIHQQIVQQEVQQYQDAYNQAHPTQAAGINPLQAIFGGAGDSVIKGAISDLSGAGKDLNKALEDSKTELDSTNAKIAAYKSALGSTQVATNDAAEAEVKLQTARDASADKQIQIAQQTAQLEATGTSKQITDRVAAIDAERAAISKQLETQGLSTQETEKLQQQLRDLAAEEERDTIVIGPLIAAREKEAEVEKAAAKDVADRATAAEKQQQDEVNAVDKYNAAVQSAEDTAANARVTANQKLQDALVAADQKAADARAQALDQYNQRSASLLENYNDAELKAQRASGDQQTTDEIKAQRQAETDLQTHLDNLKNIQDQNAQQQRDDLLNRNFRDLFLQQSKTQDATQKEDERYAKQQQQRNEALDQQGADEARAQAAQRRERLIAYQIAQQDEKQKLQESINQADEAHTKAIQTAQSAYQKELTTLQQNLIDKEALLKQDAENQLKIITESEQEKQKIFQATLDQASQLLNQVSTYAASYYSPLQTQRQAVPFASGGYDPAGQLSLVNDKYPGQREGFNNSLFPPGLGLFIPLQGGNISTGKSGGSSQPQTNNFYITSQDPAGVRREVLSVMKELTQ